MFLEFQPHFIVDFFMPNASHKMSPYLEKKNVKKIIQITFK